MQTVTSAQANAEIPINENFTTLAWAECYGKKASTTTGLTWGYWGGTWAGLNIADGTISLTANSTNYLYVVKSTGVLTKSTNISDWNNVLNARAYIVVTGLSTATSIADYRGGTGGIHGATALDGNIVTNLSTSYTSTEITVHSDTGADGVIVQASSTAAGAMSSADKVKLDGLSSATLLDRTNHTGTQSATTISDLSEAIDDRVSTLLVEGTNVTLTYNDTLNTITIDSTASGISLTSSVTPLADGSAAIGTSGEAARADHVHPASGAGLKSITASLSGTIGTLVGALRYYPRDNIVINNVVVFMGGAPTGTAVFNIRKNGVAVFSGTKPTVNTGQHESTPLNPNLTVTSSDYITIDVETASGTDATVRLDY